jgi:hypothetical protein
MDAPSHLLCPITHEVFEDPVLASDGFFYERRAIATWMRANTTSPTTRGPLRPEMTRSHAFNAILRTWRAAHGLPCVARTPGIVPPPDLIQAATEGCLDDVRFLIESGTDVHTNKEEPLYQAAVRGHLDVVQYLVEHGAWVYEDIVDAADASTRDYLASHLTKFTEEDIQNEALKYVGYVKDIKNSLPPQLMRPDIRLLITTYAKYYELKQSLEGGATLSVPLYRHLMNEFHLFRTKAPVVWGRGPKAHLSIYLAKIGEMETMLDEALI